MTHRFDTSLSLAGLFSGDNRKPTILLLTAPVLLVFFKYFGSREFYIEQLSSVIVLSGDIGFTGALYAFLASFVLLGLLPLLLVKKVFGESLADYGVQLGDAAFGWKAFLIVAPVMVIATYPSSHMADFRAEYPLNPGAGDSASTFLLHSVLYLFFYSGWEFYFRGVLQFGLRGALGDWNAILVQTIASCLVHIGKPFGETLTSILGGLVWGIIVFRSRSLLYVLLMHWILGVSLDFYISFL